MPWTDKDEELSGDTAGHPLVRQEESSTLWLRQQMHLTSMREPWYGGVAQNFRSSLRLYLPSLQAGKPVSDGFQASHGCAHGGWLSSSGLQLAQPDRCNHKLPLTVQPSASQWKHQAVGLPAAMT